MAVKLYTTIQRFIGLTTDTKPENVPVGSTFETTDQNGLVYKYDGTNWNIDTEGKATEAKQDAMILALAVDTVKTRLDITGSIAVLTTLTTNASGANFTKSGDSVYLGANDTEFNDNEKIKIFVNGVLNQRGVDAIFVTSHSFQVTTALDNTDNIVIIKGV